MFRLIRASFQQRRKTLVNSLSHAQDLPFSKEEILQGLRQVGLSESIRGEALPLTQFAALADALAIQKKMD